MDICESYKKGIFRYRTQGTINVNLYLAKQFDLALSRSTKFVRISIYIGMLLWPGSEGSPASICQYLATHSGEMMLTLVVADALMCHLALGTGDSLCICLPLEWLAVVTGTLVVHGLLQRIAFTTVSTFQENEVRHSHLSIRRGNLRGCHIRCCRPCSSRKAGHSCPSRPYC